MNFWDAYVLRDENDASGKGNESIMVENGNLMINKICNHEIWPFFKRPYLLGCMRSHA